MRFDHRIRQSIPIWLQPLLQITLLVIALAVVNLAVRVILGKWIDSRQMFLAILALGAAAALGALAFGVSRHFLFRSPAQKTWVAWPLSFVLGALVFLPLANVTLGRTPFELVPSIGWLLVYLTIPIAISLGFAYDESQTQRKQSRSSNKSLERTREG